MRALKMTGTGIMLLLAAVQTFAQTKTFSDQIGQKVNRFYFGDQISIQVDTAILLNKRTFHLYDAYYNNAKNLPEAVRKIRSLYDLELQKKDSLISKNETDYKILNDTLQSVLKMSGSVSQKTQTQLTDVQSQLTDTSGKLTDAHNELDKVQALLKDERKKENFRAIKFGLGGLLIGVIGAVILVH